MIKAKYKPYPKYRNSGVEWIGEIPEGWEVRKNKYLNNIKMGQSPDSAFENKDGDGIPFLQGNAEFGEMSPKNIYWCTQPKKVCDKKDILLSVRAPIGEINIADRIYCIGRGLSAITAILQDQIYHLLHTCKSEFQSRGLGSTFTAINNREAGNIIFPLPPLPEQKAIAEYLDNETAKIDSLIGKIEKQIELLNEYKQSLITNAVTGKIDVREAV